MIDSHALFAVHCLLSGGWSITAHMFVISVGESSPGCVAFLSRVWLERIAAAHICHAKWQLAIPARSSAFSPLGIRTNSVHRGKEEYPSAEEGSLHQGGEAESGGEHSR